MSPVKVVQCSGVICPPLTLLYVQLVAVYYLACATLATATLVLLSLAVFTDSWDVASVSGLQPGLANLTGDWRLVEVVEGRLDILYRDGVVTSHDLWVNNPSVWAATKVHIVCIFVHSTHTANCTTQGNSLI